MAGKVIFLPALAGGAAGTGANARAVSRAGSVRGGFLAAAAILHAGVGLLFVLAGTAARLAPPDQGATFALVFAPDPSAAQPASPPPEDAGTPPRADLAPAAATPPEPATHDEPAAAADVAIADIPAPQASPHTDPPPSPAPAPASAAPVRDIPPPPPAPAPSTSVPHPARPPSARRPAVARPPAHESPATAAASAPPPAASAPSPAAAVPSAGQPDGAWQRGVVLWLQSHRTYPPAAQRRGEQGAALVRLTVDRDGRVREFKIVQSTGSARLDEAIETLLAHAALPAFPASMPQAQAVIEVPIRYRLES